MSQYLIKSLEVEGLWGIRDAKVSFHPDVTILIGPNGSGKTTLLNLLRFVLNADVEELSTMAFKSVVVQLAEFDGDSVRTIRCDAKEGTFRFQVANRAYDVSILARRPRFVPPPARAERQLLRKALQDLVPAIWLPVTRRLPVSESDDDAIHRGERDHSLESVDERLRHLRIRVARYRAALEAQISLRHKAFEKKVLQDILYNKTYDTFSQIGSAPSDEERLELTRAFDQAGLLDEHTTERIAEHFVAAKAAVERLQADPKKVSIEDLFVIPLISRTRSMVEAARQLEQQRVHLMHGLVNYVKTVNSFLSGKRLRVTAEGVLQLRAGADNSAHTFAVDQLSSGEKQILILLTEALLWEGRSVVYVADEPELSLHVTWQEKLIQSIRKIASRTQIIVATHSPDIVGEFRDRVVELSIADS
jgi:predicted ATPase